MSLDLGKLLSSTLDPSRSFASWAHTTQQTRWVYRLQFPLKYNSYNWPSSLRMSCGLHDVHLHFTYKHVHLRSTCTLDVHYCVLCMYMHYDCVYVQLHHVRVQSFTCTYKKLPVRYVFVQCTCTFYIFMNMYMYIVYFHVHVHVHCMFTGTCTCTLYIFMYMYIVYFYVHVHCIFLCTCTLYIYMHMYMYIVYLHVHVLVHVHCIFTCTCTYTVLWLCVIIYVCRYYTWFCYLYMPYLLLLAPPGLLAVECEKVVRGASKRVSKRPHLISAPYPG